MVSSVPMLLLILRDQRLICLNKNFTERYVINQYLSILGQVETQQVFRQVSMLYKSNGDLTSRDTYS